MSPLPSSITRGDYLTLYNGCNDEDSIDTDLSAALSISPKYGKKDDGFQFRELCKSLRMFMLISTSIPESANK